MKAWQLFLLMSLIFSNGTREHSQLFSWIAMGLCVLAAFFPSVFESKP